MMEKKTLLLCVITSALVSSASTAFILSLQKSDGESNTDVAITEPLMQRIASLEERLLSISGDKKNDTPRLRVESTPTLSTPLIASKDETEATPIETAPSFAELRQQRREQRLAQLQPGYRNQQLVDAGFAQEEAARIVQLEASESLRQLERQYQARRQQLEGQDLSLASTNPIRAELGDENYERYLNANGLPTTASIGSVIGGSPGENAGLRAGDNIVSYAGERVFNLTDVNLLTAQGRVGQTVLIEVERDGETVQLSIPRGPIGINSGRRGFRR